MYCAFVLIDRRTNEPDGVVSTHLENLGDFDYDRQTHNLIVVEKDHPIFSGTDPHRHFHLRDGEVVKKPQAQIDAEKAAQQTRQATPTKSVEEVLLDLINEERQANGKVALTMDEVRERALREARQ